MTTVTISMPESLKQFIDHAVETQGYGNVSEYVRCLLREAQTKEANARLEALLLQGLASEEDLSLTPQFWNDLRADAARLLSASKPAYRPRAAWKTGHQFHS